MKFRNALYIMFYKARWLIILGCVNFRYGYRNEKQEKYEVIWMLC